MKNSAVPSRLGAISSKLHIKRAPGARASLAYRYKVHKHGAREHKHTHTRLGEVQREKRLRLGRQSSARNQHSPALALNIYGDTINKQAAAAEYNASGKVLCGAILDSRADHERASGLQRSRRRNQH
jgi:hypothetical protein